jgi:hypothetical protein
VLLVAGGCAALLPCGLAGEALGATFPAACAGTTGSAASLVAAINSANATPALDTVQLGSGCRYALTTPNNNWYGANGLPAISSPITVDGRGATIARAVGAAPFRFFFVGANPTSTGYVSPGAGSLTLQSVTLTGGVAKGGDSNGGGGGGGFGGAIFNQGAVLIDRSTLSANQALGGWAIEAGAGLSGGGMGTDGTATVGGGFGPGTFGGAAGGTGGAMFSDDKKGGGGGAGFRSSEPGGNATSSAAGSGGGPRAGLGGEGGSYGSPGGLDGDGSGGGGKSGEVGENGGAFGQGGTHSTSSGGAGGGGGGIGGGGSTGTLTGGAGPGGGGGGFGGGGAAGTPADNFGAGGGQGGHGGFGGGGGGGGGPVGPGAEGPGGGGGYGGATGDPSNGAGTRGAGGGGAGLGGAIFNMQGSLTVRNSTLAGNAAVGGSDNAADNGKGLGGAVFNLSGTFTATSATLATNSADYFGAALVNLVYDATTFRQAQSTLRNTVVAGNVGPDQITSTRSPYHLNPSPQGSADVNLAGFDLVKGTIRAGDPFFPTTDLATVTGTPSTADPQLGPLQGNGGLTQTMAPASNSPVVDAGSAFGLTTDQRGLSRPFNFAAFPNSADGSDIGAVELPLTRPSSGPGGGTAAGFGAKTLVTLKLLKSRIPSRGPVSVRVTNANGFKVTGRLGGQTVRKVATSRKRRVKLAAKSFSVGAGSRKTVKLKLPRALRRLLKRTHRLSLGLTARVKDPAGHTRTVKKRVKPKLKVKRRKRR